MATENTNSLAFTSDIILSVLNEATKTDTVYVGEATTLDVVLTNSIGSDISLSVGDAPSTLAIYLPEFYTANDLKDMKAELDGWTFSAEEYSLNLVYAGISEGVWKNGEAISFKITNAKSSQAATHEQVNINLQNMDGENVPSQAQANLTLANAPKVGNGDLNKAVALEPDTQTVYVSTAGDPLENTLRLNIKNTRSDGKPLYSGTNIWSGSPQIIVSFLYGSLPGDLATSADKSQPQVGSAWNIKGKVAISEGNTWNVTNPNNEGQEKNPKWILKPDSTNKDIIGREPMIILLLILPMWYPCYRLVIPI